MKKKQQLRSERINTSIQLLSLFLEEKISCSDIAKDVLDNKMQDEFRSIGWRIFLNILPVCNNIDDNWRNITKKNREEYNILLQEHIYYEESLIKYIRKEIKSEQLVLDQNLKDILDLIILDVSRTFQDITLFCSDGIKETLTILLFIWSKNNLSVGYIQGMNEIIGTIIYALFPSNLVNINYEAENECNDKINTEIKVDKSHTKDNKHDIKYDTKNDSKYDIKHETIIHESKHGITHEYKQVNKLSSNKETKIINHISDDVINNEERRTSIFNIKKAIEDNLLKMQKDKHQGGELKKMNTVNGIKSSFNNSNANTNYISNSININNTHTNTNNIASFHSPKKQNRQEPHFDELKCRQLRKRAANLFFFLNSEEHFDADVYSIFNDLMERCLKDLFNYSKQDRKSEFTFNDDYRLSITLEQIELTDLSVIKKRIASIFFYYLRLANPQLFEHLIDKVDPFIFMFRWLLCVLNREIPLKNIVYIWDSIFIVEELDKKKSIFNKDLPYGNLNFLDHICVSMIDNIKDELFAFDIDDSTYMLHMLMNYPSKVNPKNIVATGLKFREKYHEALSKDYDFI